MDMSTFIATTKIKELKNFKSKKLRENLVMQTALNS